MQGDEDLEQRSQARQDHEGGRLSRPKGYLLMWQNYLMLIRLDCLVLMWLNYQDDDS